MGACFRIPPDKPSKYSRLNSKMKTKTSLLVAVFWLIPIFFFYLVGSNAHAGGNGGGQIPEWLINPSHPDGLGSASCVSESGNRSIDRLRAVTFAKSDISNQLDVSVRAIKKGQNKKTVPNKLQTVKESRSKTVLREVMIHRDEVVNIDGKSMRCVLVVVRGIPAESSEAH